MLAGALVFPGDLPRVARRCEQAAPVAVRLVLGTVPLFVIAAAHRGLLHAERLDPVRLKLAVGGVIAAALLAAYWSCRAEASAATVATAARAP